MAITRYAGRFVAPTRVSRIATAKWFVPQSAGWRMNGGSRLVDPQHRVEFNVIVSGRNGQGEGPDPRQDIARVVGERERVPERLGQRGHVDVDLAPLVAPGRGERAIVGIV